MPGTVLCQQEKHPCGFRLQHDAPHRLRSPHASSRSRCAAAKLRVQAPFGLPPAACSLLLQPRPLELLSTALLLGAVTVPATVRA